VTLLELMVGLAILSILGMIVAQAGRLTTRRPMNFSLRIDSLRHIAIRSGRTISVFIRDSSRSGEILVLPTGSVIADSTLRITPLPGRAEP